MERISDEKLFYLRSRWLHKKNALNMMIDSYINELFSWLELIDKDFFDNVSAVFLLKNACIVLHPFLFAISTFSTLGSTPVTSDAGYLFFKFNKKNRL